MAPQESFPTQPSPQNRSLLRYAVSLVLLVLIIGGIAWVTQYLPRWTKTKPASPAPGASNANKLLKFERDVAQWSNVKRDSEAPEKESYRHRDYEPGQKGYYDFPFRNISGDEVEVVFYMSSCDCASVQVCALPGEDLDRAIKAIAEKPADPIQYGTEPSWTDLLKQADWEKLSKDARDGKRLLVKPNDGGVVRVRWVAKAAGQEMNVRPSVAFRKPGEARISGQTLGVPLMVALPVRFHPPRKHVGGLTAGKKVTEEFFAWSSTREKLDLKLAAANDPLFETSLSPLSPKECEDLESTLKNDPLFSASKLQPRVLSAQRVSITVHESRGGQQLDLGSFFRKLDVTLDGIPQRDIPGPEIVGRVHGDIVIGGADDQGRVRFKEFNARIGASKTVEISADSRWKLETFKQDPAWINVNLTKDTRQEDPKRTIWQLEVVVPENTPAAHSFEEPNAVILRIPGTPDRFVRIPIEGHLAQ